MRTMYGWAVVACALAIMAAPARAVTYFGSGGSILDNSTFSDTIVVPDSLLITDVIVSLVDLTHAWIGDLTVTLTHVDTATTVDLFRRVGPTSSLGDSSNLNGTYRFNDAFTGDLWAQAASGGSTFVIPGGDYFPSSKDLGTFAELPSSLAPFVGQDTLGSWTLSIQDSASLDQGALGSWSLTFSTQQVNGAVPEPMTAGLGLLGLLTASLAALRRRRA